MARSKNIVGPVTNMAFFTDDEISEEFKRRGLIEVPDLEDFSDSEIEEEYEARNLGTEPSLSEFVDSKIIEYVKEAGLLSVFGDADERDIRLLAEMIMSGDKDAALDLLNDLTGNAIPLHAIKKIHAQHVGRLF